MDEIEFRKLRVQLTKLTPGQAETVRQLVVGTRRKDLGKIPQDDWLLQHVVERLLTLGLLGRAAIPALMRSSSYRQYVGVRDEVLKDLDSAISGGLQSRQRVQLAHLVTDSIVAWLRAGGREPTPGAVLRSLGYTREAINRSFPGYIASGLLHVALGGSAGMSHHPRSGGGDGETKKA